MARQEDKGPIPIQISIQQEEALEVLFQFQNDLYLLVFASKAFAHTDVSQEDLV